MQGIWAQGPKHFKFNNTSNSTKQFKIRCYPLLPPTKMHQRIISTTYYCATTSLTLSHERTGVIPQKKNRGSTSQPWFECAGYWESLPKNIEIESFLGTPDHGDSKLCDDDVGVKTLHPVHNLEDSAAEVGREWISSASEDHVDVRWTDGWICRWMRLQYLDECSRLKMDDNDEQSIGRSRKGTKNIFLGLYSYFNCKGLMVSM